MYCWPTASIRHGESLSIAKRVVKAEFEMDTWLFTNSNKQFFQTSKLYYVETQYIGLEKLFKLLFCRPTDPMLAYFWPEKHKFKLKWPYQKLISYWHIYLNITRHVTYL